MTGVLVVIFLAAVVAANLLVQRFGPPATPYVSFALVGADLTVRDALHERWGESRKLWVYMAALIAAGGLLSFVINANAGRIALWSCIAFVAAGAVDLGVYHLLRNLPRSDRVNLSNIAAAAVDSVVFITGAFGRPIWGIIFLQFVAKVAGGVIWRYVFMK